jgi:glycosyltransferase involved in cell wall biosynthesis
MRHKQTDIALFLPSLRGGGAERVMLNLAEGFSHRGLDVELVLASAVGEYLGLVPPSVQLIDLKAPRVLASLPALVRYLRRVRPRALLSALDHANVVVLLARRLARMDGRVVISVHNHYSSSAASSRKIKVKILTLMMRWLYPGADAIVTVSHGVADDLTQTIGLDKRHLHTIYNPVVTPTLLTRLDEPVDHPWFMPGQPPVVLGVGRLTAQKDFPTLIRAFAELRQKREAHLIILGEGEDRTAIEGMIKELGIEHDVALPGFVSNPYPYMKHAAVFCLSSAWEGLSSVLVEAMACGTPVVSTDCPSGPSEILEGGRCGMLVPVGDPAAMATAIEHALSAKSRAPVCPNRFGLEQAVDQYLKLLLPVYSPVRAIT